MDTSHKPHPSQNDNFLVPNNTHSQCNDPEFLELPDAHLPHTPMNLDLIHLTMHQAVTRAKKA